MNAIQHNLDVVDRHIRDEARDVDSVLALYTDDVVFEAPHRAIRLVGKQAIREMYVAMFGAMAEVEIEPLDRFATETRVVDDMLARFRIAGPGIRNCPLPVGVRVELRLIHHFTIRDGLIAREQTFEVWNRIP